MPTDIYRIRDLSYQVRDRKVYSRPTNCRIITLEAVLHLTLYNCCFDHGRVAAAPLRCIL